MSIELMILFNHFIFCHLLLLPSIFPRIRVFSNELALCVRVSKYWNFISPSNEYSGLISFRTDWFDLCAARGTLKSLLQHHSLKASFFQHSTFFIVQLSHSYMTIGKIIALIRWTFVDKAMSLLFNTLYVCHSFSSKVQAYFKFHRCSHCLQWFGAQENKMYHCFHFFPHLFAMKWWDQMPWL